MEYTRLIKAIKKYIPVTDEESRIIQTLFRPKVYKKKDCLLQAGSTCRHLYFIDTGLVRYFLENKEEEITYNFAREGEFVCDYISFLEQSPSEKTIECLEDTQVLVIPHRDLQQFYTRVAQGERFGRLCMESFYVSSIRQIKSLYVDKPGQRYLNFVRTYPDLQQRVPQYYISSYVGVKPPSLSRIRKRFLHSVY